MEASVTKTTRQRKTVNKFISVYKYETDIYNIKQNTKAHIAHLSFTAVPCE